MKTISISNQKGGVGKSTIAVHLAFYLSELDKSVLFIDLDSQANATKTLSNAAYVLDETAHELFNEKVELNNSEGGSLTLIKATQELADLERAKPDVISQFKTNIAAMKGFDYCIIDTPPTLGLRMTAALISSSHCLAPIELEEYSIDGITNMLKTIYGIREKWNESLEFLGMLPNRFNPRSIAQKDTLTALLKNYSNLLIQSKIGIRASIPESLAQSIPVWKNKKTSAREAGKEFKETFNLILKKIEG